MADSDAPSNVVPLSRLRAALARPRGARRVEALLSADDAAAAVAALPVPELYFLVAEVGIGDTTELLSLATPEQIQGCVDFDAWDRDRASTEALMPWLAAVLEGGYERLTQVWEGLDPELAALFLARTTRIYDRTLDEVAPEDEERPLFTTPDTFFDVVITTDDEEEGKLVYAIIEDLYRGDMGVARHALMTARSELPSELEEMSYRWRSGRMADLGYADFYDALEVFRPLAPHSVRIGEGTAEGAPAPTEGEPTELPAPMLDQVVGRAFLARALEQVVDAAEADRLQAALLVLVNKVLSAARVPPGDAEAVAVGTEHATSTLALGLEHVSGGVVERAVEALGTISLTRLHRLGYSLTLRLSRFGRVLAPRAGAAGEPSASVLAAILAARPYYAVVLDGAGETGVRPFESLEDLRRAADHLTELALRIAIADALGADLLALSKAPEPRPALNDTARTALVRLLSAGVLDAAPLSVDELEAFRRRELRGEPARDLALSAMAAALDRAEVVESRERLPALVDAWLADLAALDQLAADQPVDPRFVEGVITSAGKH